MQFLRIILVCFVFLAGHSALAEQRVLHIATGDYAPFTDQTAPDDGIVNDAVRQLARTAGFDVAFEYMPWMRALEMTRAAHFFASSYWYFSEDRTADFIHVGPVVYDRMVLIRREDTTLPDWESMADLKGVTIGAVTGYTYTEDFWELAESGALRVETAQNDEANLRKLLAGRIDVYPMSEESGKALMSRIFSEEERSQITMEPKPLMVTEGYLLVSRNARDAKEIAIRLQDALDRLGPATAQENG
ncbi:substrate-binding periplasmic protein [Roseobacter sp. S98]|uniref:substrate-binding periplasmic protein n=1 Tax=Roseobacter algicola (ex Choi et al. 2025) (nom. illeg.) TaxID=3092138 RepID=UPI0035C6CD68